MGGFTTSCHFVDIHQDGDRVYLRKKLVIILNFLCYTKNIQIVTRDIKKGGVKDV